MWLSSLMTLVFVYRADLNSINKPPYLNIIEHALLYYSGSLNIYTFTIFAFFLSQSFKFSVLTFMYLFMCHLLFFQIFKNNFLSTTIISHVSCGCQTCLGCTVNIFKTLITHWYWILPGCMYPFVKLFCVSFIIFYSNINRQIY